MQVIYESIKRQLAKYMVKKGQVRRSQVMKGVSELERETESATGKEIPLFGICSVFKSPTRKKLWNYKSFGCCVVIVENTNTSNLFHHFEEKKQKKRNSLSLTTMTQNTQEL